MGNEAVLREKIKMLRERVSGLETGNTNLRTELEKAQGNQGDPACDHEWGFVDYTCGKCGMLKSKVVEKGTDDSNDDDDFAVENEHPEDEDEDNEE